MRRKPKARHIALGVALLCVWSTQAVPALAACYAQRLYPSIARVLSAFSELFPFAVGDLFIALCLVAFVGYPLYALLHRNPGWKPVCLRLGQGALWLYVWFYAAWGLNYAQPPLYTRIGMPPVAYTQEGFERFATQYIDRLNAAYTPIATIDSEVVSAECFQLYTTLAHSLGIHRPPKQLRAKTMLFSSLASGVGVTGSMAPFFCEFTLNGHLLPANYPATYAHELAHRLGITSEAEANFYAYHVCTRSQVPAMRFSGYFSVLPHVLHNARLLLPQADYRRLQERIRPEVRELAQHTRAYWAARYNPVIGAIQGWAYDLYLRSNKIADGRQNYSAVVGLLMAYDEWNNNQPHKPTPCHIPDKNKWKPSDASSTSSTNCE